MTPHKALQMSERIQTAISYLVILGMLSDTEGGPCQGTTR